MNARRIAWLLLAASLISACASPPAAPTPEPPTEAPAPAALAPTAVILQPTATLIPLPTAAPVLAPLACSPEVTANTIVNVRNGPGMIYSIIGSLAQGATSRVDGKIADGSWWYILLPSVPGGHGWVAGSVTTTNCMTPSLPVIDASALPAPYAAAVTNVEVSVDPSEIDVPGCVGEAQRMTAWATIHASGPMQVTYYFEIDGAGTTKPHTVTFTEWGSRDVSETFRPEVKEGGHWVRLWIEGLNLSGWPDRARYRINCP